MNKTQFEIGDKVISKYTSYPNDRVNGTDTIIDIFQSCDKRFKAIICQKPNGDIYSAIDFILELVHSEY